MTILTGVVLTIALGAVAQRGDVFSEFAPAAGIEPRDDVATLPPIGLWRIDVVANDAGATRADGARLLVTSPPACGAAWRIDGALAYEAAPGGCFGRQRISYCLADGDACPEAVVTLELSASVDVASSATATPLAPMIAAAPAAATAAVSSDRISGFKVEGARPAGPGGPFAAISAFGSLAPAETEAAGSAAGESEAADPADRPAAPAAD